MKTNNLPRGRYGELCLGDLPKTTIAWYLALEKAIQKALPAWQQVRNADFDRYGRGWSLSIDLYAVGKDMHSGKRLAIVQIRQYVKHTKNGYPTIRKNYFLIGRNENGAPFAHAVSAHTVRGAVNRGVDPILAAQRWMFGVDYAVCSHRQGDVVAIPVPAGKMPKTATPAMEVRLPDRHSMAHCTSCACAGDRMFALDAVITHPEHPTISLPGWAEIITAQADGTWNFSPPTID